MRFRPRRRMRGRSVKRRAFGGRRRSFGRRRGRAGRLRIGFRF